ncbi:hypothetical protein RDWZM_008120 [Blomia tropicalis]|uniref:Nudix hydrolase domain-containing protein n=1 Tax=Blomia tropicalis TaxID=40697 RepID=A0A9Q0LYR7_BLOTA|nr:hypothetical protein BLOT_003828 [Blomia tropicalis]KAJ6216963.1 hypothetical protein RDWZM_008120 [Blomia tropicalis]
MFYVCTRFTSNIIKSRTNLCSRLPSFVLQKKFSSQNDSLDKIIPSQIDNYGSLRFNATDVNKLSSFSVGQFEKLVLDQINRSPSDPPVRSLWFQLGFEFHHTKRDYLVLVKPLVHSTNIPNYAYTNIGVGALVVDEHKKILVVKEKRFYFKQMWKLPGGYVEQGEELSQAAEREVLEETGVKCQFQNLILMRHLHRFAFDCADMYFVCLLRPLSKTIQNRDDECDAVCWMSIDDIIPQLTPFNRFILEKYIEFRGSSLSIKGETFDPQFASMPAYTIYSMKSDLPDNSEVI